MGNCRSGDRISETVGQTTYSSVCVLAAFVRYLVVSHLGTFFAELFFWRLVASQSFLNVLVVNSRK